MHNRPFCDGYHSSRSAGSASAGRSITQSLPYGLGSAKCERRCASDVRWRRSAIVKSLPMGQTKANVNPLLAIPQITGAENESKHSVAFGAPFHSCPR